MRRICLTLAFLLCTAAPRATQWEVNPRHPQAADENPGTPDRPFKTIARAARAVAAGDTVRIHDGIYRESVTVDQSGTPDKPITFEAAPGEHVILTGADRPAQWRPEAGPEKIYSTPWPHRFITWSKQMTHPDDEYHRVVGRSEQVFVYGYPCLQVLGREQLARGTFFVDLNAGRLYVCPAEGRDLTREGEVEAAARAEIWQSKGAFIRVRGLRFRYAANMAQHGAATFSGQGDVVEDCVFERMNSVGAVFTGQDITVRRSVFQDNGQLGFGASGAHRLLLQDCIVRNNNVKGFSRGWEAGGDKLVLCRAAVIERCQIVANRGNGLWFDIGNEDCEVRGCLIADNEDSGIFYEISYGLRAHDNVIVGNGFAGTPGSWGAACGISLSSSPGCLIERNLLVGNKEGFNFREQDRTTSRIGDRAERPIWNHDQVIRNNVLAYNRDAQTWGWFDVGDGRLWPAALQEAVSAPAPGAAPRADIARGYQAQAGRRAPAGLDLEKLKITFENNLYFAAPGQGLFTWGVDWKKNRKYHGLDEVQRELGLEKGSRQAEIGFRDFLARDFRVPPDSPALQLGCYPRLDVPGVTLNPGLR